MSGPSVIHYTVHDLFSDSWFLFVVTALAKPSSTMRYIVQTYFLFVNCVQISRYYNPRCALMPFTALIDVFAILKNKQSNKKITVKTSILQSSLSRSRWHLFKRSCLGLLKCDSHCDRCASRCAFGHSIQSANWIKPPALRLPRFTESAWSPYQIELNWIKTSTCGS